MSLYTFILLSFCVSVLSASNSHTVTYGPSEGCHSYRGQTLGNGITTWFGIRYAAPPLGNLRFRAPQPPACLNAVQNATEHGPICFATGDTSVPSGFSEDCLFLDVYAPTQTNPNTTAGGWPVFIFLQGGGLNSLSNPNMNAVPFIQSSGNNFVVVTFNYRVGPYGFLTSQEVKANGDLNIGLLDQRAVFKWVQENIHLFGGNPNHVVIGGDSAGAGSVVLHLTAYGGRNDNLFHAGASESQSFGAQLTVEQSQYQYDALVQRVGCKSHSDTLACLRDVSINTLQGNNTVVPTPGGAGGNPVFMYSNVVDGNFTRNVTYNSIANGNFIKVPVIFGDVTNEGTIFVPNTISNYTQANAFMKNNFVNLTPSQLSKLDSLYPPAETFPNTGKLWRTTSNMYGEVRYICPGLYLSQAFTAYGVSKNYNYHWNVEVAADMESGLGVPHVAELAYIWGGSSVSNIQAYWTSFIRGFDVNEFMPSGSVVWKEWDSGYTGQRILFESGNETMEIVPVGSGTQGERCEYAWSIAPSLQQ